MISLNTRQPLDSTLRQLLAAQAAVLGSRHIPRDDRFPSDRLARQFEDCFGQPDNSMNEVN